MIMPWPTSYNSHGLILTTIEGSIHGQKTINTLWLSYPGELAAPDWPAILLQAAEAVLSCALTTLLPGLSNEWSLLGVRAKLMTVADKQERFAAAPANSVGALGQALPSFCSGVIQWRTPYTGKRRRGRMCVPAMVEAEQQQSTITGVPLAQLVAFAACIIGKFRYNDGTENFDAVIYSRETGYTAPSTYSGALEHYAPIISAAVRNTVGTVNTRKVGRGS